MFKRPAVTFPAAEHRRRLASIKLYCSVREIRVRVCVCVCVCVCVMRWLQLRFDFDSTATRLLIKGHKVTVTKYPNRSHADVFGPQSAQCSSPVVSSVVECSAVELQSSGSRMAVESKLNLSCNHRMNDPPRVAARTRRGRELNPRPVYRMSNAPQPSYAAEQLGVVQ